MTSAAEPDPAEPPTLPRRTERTHLEPQLAEPWGAGDGTPFTAFAAADTASPAGRPAADFHEGAARGRDHS